MANVAAPLIDFTSAVAPTSEAAIIAHEDILPTGVLAYTGRVLPSPSAFQLVEEAQAGYPI